MNTFRQDHELPPAITEWGWRYHHIGIPTTGPIKNETYLQQYKFYFGGFSTSPFGIEWMRFDADSPVHDLIKRIPHVAFEVDDLDLELQKHDFTVIGAPGSPSAGVRSAMIEHNGAPIELIEFASEVKKQAASRK
jgi:hypothetical protein